MGSPPKEGGHGGTWVPPELITTYDFRSRHYNPRMKPISATLPGPLLKIATLATHRARTQHIIDELDGEDCYNNGFDIGSIILDPNPRKTQSPYRTFCNWCKLNCTHLQKYSNNWELAERTTPPDSVWRKRVMEYRDIILRYSPDKSFEQIYTTRKSIIVPRVFWPWVSRTWRTLPPSLKNAFIATSMIRSLGIATVWTEHIWNTVTPHPTISCTLSTNRTSTDQDGHEIFQIKHFNFGRHTRLVGPQAPDTQYVYRGNLQRAVQCTVSLSGWSFPIWIVHGYAIPRMYLRNTKHNIFFRIWVYENRFDILENMLGPLKST